MNYAFKGVEDFLLRPATKLSRKSERGTEIDFELATRLAQARQSFTLLILAQDSSEEARRVVRFHQRLLLSFANRPPSRKTGGESNRKLAVGWLLKFLQNDHAQHFDFNALWPDLLRPEIAKKVSDCISSLREMIFQAKIDDPLANLLIQILSNIQDLRFSLTFAVANAVDAYCDKLALLSTTSSSRDQIADEIMALLIQLNIDIPQTFDYYVKNFNAALTKMDSDQDRLNLAALYLKKISQTPLSLHTQVDSGRLKTLLMEWLFDEIQYIERRLVTTPQQETSDPKSGTFKLTVDLSVAQLAFIARTFVESGVIQNKNTTEMVSFFSKFVKTKRSGSVSQESLRIKYYDVESGTKDSVRSLLHNAIGYINKT